MFNICDDFNNNCLVRACCSEICDKVKTLVDSYLNYHMDKDWLYDKLVNEETCPVCGKYIFWFSEYTSYDSTNIKVKLACDFCYATYRITIDQDTRTLNRIEQAYQGTINGQVHTPWNMKQIKEYLLEGGVL